MLRVLFLGNHTVGVRTLQTLASQVNIVGVVAHPPDPEDGIRYLSVCQFAIVNKWPYVRGRPQDSDVTRFVEEREFDLLWITDYRYIVPSLWIEQPHLGAVNLHPSLLPLYRGRASINWAILKGETRLGLTAHFVDAGMDSGDIISQIPYDLSLDEDVGDALERLYPLYQEITLDVIRKFESQQITRLPQNHALATTFGRRVPEDGVINWRMPSEAIVNLIRAVAAPYPGAFTYLKGRKVMVWKAHSFTGNMPSNVNAGQIVEIEEQGAIIACGSGAVVLESVEDALTQAPVVLERDKYLGAIDGNDNEENNEK